uniref:NADH-ubiquinone oxidoreductase chain 5 n=1 Tax=Osphya bipunctata TaxID=1227470 RepID=S4SVG3_9CUCU|nr:NADH dehydrogenase subunit 5 [Osphya bipunctata]
MIKICKVYSLLFLMLSLSLFGSSMKYLFNSEVIFIELEMLMFNSSIVVMTLLFDWMSLMFMSFVLFISSMVIFYSEEYMSGEVYLNRFILLVVMFVLSMMLLIISPNLISILLGWDGLGLVSYCLVIYYQNVKSFNAGMITALSNRIGDVALLISIVWMLNFGSWNFYFYLSELKSNPILMLISFLVLLAAMTKSAQIPFSSWLPAAMAAPTPVSSLVHSSTLVTAGVYLLIRFNYCFNSFLMFILLFIGSMTMFMSGVGANFEFDLKKIIALSTLSQLGLMMSILALGSYKLAFFHLLTHALFKALLFMCAGNVIHNLNNCQDIRFMGGLMKGMPLTCAFMNISNLALCGLPFLSGFYSKDLIVEFMSMNFLNFFIYVIFYISIGLTVCYSFRLVYYSIVGDFNFNSLNGISDEGKIMLKGMGGLIMLVIVMGSGISWLIFSSPYVIILPFFLKIMTLICIFVGIYLGLEVSKFSFNYSNNSLNFLKMSSFFGSMWNLPFLSTNGINFGFLHAGKGFYQNVDQGWLEFHGAQNLNSNFVMFSKKMQILFYNNMKMYFMLMIMFFILISLM